MVIETRRSGYLIDECKRLEKTLAEISIRYSGPLSDCAGDTTLLPFVLLLGNHSSGKSSFINNLIGRKVQTTGVAPTDDCFTVIGAGDADIDRDGPAFLG